MGALRLGLRVRKFEHFRDPERAEWPTLSVVVAARDEVTKLRATVEALCLGDYPKIEVHIVDDRSSDGTGPLADALAAEHANVFVTHIDRLPADWLGKTHALQAGLSAVRGDWVLLTDGDVRIEAGSLRRAVQACEDNGWAHLSVLPSFLSGGYLQHLATAAANGVLLMGRRVLRLPRKDPRAFIGIGAFNLFRRDAWARTPGFEALRMEVLDDVGVAYLLRSAGASAGFCVSTSMISVQWHSGLMEMASGLEKVFLRGARYRSLRLLAQGLGLLFIATAPVLALMLGPKAISDFAALTCTLPLVTAAIARRRGHGGLPVDGLLFRPVGHLVLALMVLRTAFLSVGRRDLLWRGTRYAFAALRAGSAGFR